MRINLMFCVVWVLGLVLMVASLDAAPDPPAVDPHGAAAKAFSVRDCAGCLRDQPGAATMPTRAQTERIAFTHEDEPGRPSALMAETRHATDPSPPVLG
jgi:hypothetical protein